MMAYVITTGAIFGLLTVLHIWRAIEENPLLAKNPWYILITSATTALCVWAVWLVRRKP
jgi:hypothetical protein